jgi:hypothetical protein
VEPPGGKPEEINDRQRTDPLDGPPPSQVAPVENSLLGSTPPDTRHSQAPRLTKPAPKPLPEPAPEPEPITADTAVPEPAPPAAQTDTLRAPAPDEDTVVAVPPPARAPDTVGTARPVPPASPRPVLPSMEASGPAPVDAVTLPAGTEFHAALVDSIHSRHDSAGQSLTAKVMENVLGPDGSTLIPAGSLVRLTVVRLEPATSKSSADGKLELKVDGITRGDDVLEVTAELRPIPHELRGRGVTGSEAAKVGVGAAAGAIAGRVLGGDTRGAVIGGVVGAAGGAGWPLDGGPTWSSKGTPSSS